MHQTYTEWSQVATRPVSTERMLMKVLGFTCAVYYPASLRRMDTEQAGASSLIFGWRHESVGIVANLSRKSQKSSELWHFILSVPLF